VADPEVLARGGVLRGHKGMGVAGVCFLGRGKESFPPARWSKECCISSLSGAPAETEFGAFCPKNLASGDYK